MPGVDRGVARPRIDVYGFDGAVGRDALGFLTVDDGTGHRNKYGRARAEAGADQNPHRSHAPLGSPERTATYQYEEQCARRPEPKCVDGVDRRYRDGRQGQNGRSLVGHTTWCAATHDHADCGDEHQGDTGGRHHGGAHPVGAALAVQDRERPIGDVERGIRVAGSNHQRPGYGDGGRSA
ncbi:Uncharacterised protein [Mycobacteroides abscessus subsp. abscessus]|nr:Uncharacterised protein [Mycobacteroides abscessus subsp. abscessus]